MTTNKSFDEHKRLYPEQYSHPLVGKKVRLQHGKTGKVVRVIFSQFGPLACLDSLDNKVAWAINTLTVLED